MNWDNITKVGAVVLSLLGSYAIASHQASRREDRDTLLEVADMRGDIKVIKAILVELKDDIKDLKTRDQAVRREKSPTVAEPYPTAR